MDNFYFINIKPTIERKDTASIKDAIFKRAQEKETYVPEEEGEGLPSQVQKDTVEFSHVGERDSNKNLFNQFIERFIVKKSNQAEINVQNEEPAVLEEINEKDIKQKIEEASTQAYENSVKEETMKAARNQFRPETNLMATLNFLNTQAAIQMAKNANSKIKPTD